MAKGATICELAACQAVLLRASDQRDPGDAILVLELLSAPPFSFATTDFAKIREFLRKPDRLPAFLSVLARHGLVKPTDVLAFDECFASVDDVLVGPFA